MSCESRLVLSADPGTVLNELLQAKELVYHLEKPVNELRGRLASSRVVSGPRKTR